MKWSWYSYVYMYVWPENGKDEPVPPDDVLAKQRLLFGKVGSAENEFCSDRLFEKDQNDTNTL